VNNPDPLFACLREEAVSRGQFLAEADALSSTLPEGAYAINFCEDRYLFCLGLAACLRRGLITLLPPDRSTRHLERLAHDYPGALLLADQPRPDAPAAHRVTRLPVTPLAAEANLGVDAGQFAVIAFTSGSTGAPRAHPKTWGSLVESARLIDTQLGGTLGKTLIATVPPQHMYGLELSILLPLCQGTVMETDKPFFPADIAAALHRSPAPRVLVTTPIHLRALLNSGLTLPPLALLVSATAPLDPVLARICEQRFNAPLLEIYGCTEAGSIAGRRTARDEPWTLYEGIELQAEGQHCRVRAPHLPEPVELHDALILLDDRQFELEGRATDLINIAGKRGSLSAFNRILLDIPGVLDGAFFLPESGIETTPRLIVFAVAPTLASDELLQSLRKELDPAFLPRAIHRVDALPRSETGKLPRQALERLALTA
jgi:acyl-coenzyme A synthetase/AMP-(fatty) acid ligase